MNCPNCGHELTHGAKVALCLNCGYTEPLGAHNQPGTATAPEAAIQEAPAAAADSAPTPDFSNYAPAGAQPAAEPVASAETPSYEAQPPVAAVPPTPIAPSPDAAPMAPTPSGWGAPLPASDNNAFQTPAPKVGRVKLALLIGIPLLLVAGAAYAADITLIKPKNALADYLNKLGSVKTAAFNGTASYSGGSGSSLGLGDVSLTLNGTYDITDKATPKADVTAGLSAGGLLSSSIGKLEAEFRSIGDTNYFKLSNTALLQAFGLNLGTGWYKVDDSDVSNNSASTLQCSDTSGSKTSGIFTGQQIATKLPLKNTKLAGFNVSVSGHRTNRYTGEVDVPKLQSFVDAANKKLTKDCQISYSADDLKDTTITYDLWSGSNFDRLNVRIASKDQGAIGISLDTSNYNKAVSISAPSGAKSLKDSLATGETDGSLDNTSIVGASARQKANDTQRKTDLHAMQKALEEYFINNNIYPTSLAALIAGPAPIMKSIPVDPTNTDAYKYVYTDKNGQAYTLTACLETSGDTGFNTVAAIAPCTTRSFLLSNQN